MAAAIQMRKSVLKIGVFIDAFSACGDAERPASVSAILQ